jgi:DNA-directed RNA polymerase specialized sigma24 family protein
VIDHRLSPETWTLIREAIQSLPPPAQDAFLLRYAFGLPVASQDPDELTVARLLGVSDRTIRTRLQQAEQSLEKWREGL